VPDSQYISLTEFKKLSPQARLDYLRQHPPTTVAGDKADGGWEQLASWLHSEINVHGQGAQYAQEFDTIYRGGAAAQTAAAPDYNKQKDALAAAAAAARTGDAATAQAGLSVAAKAGAKAGDKVVADAAKKSGTPEGDLNAALAAAQAGDLPAAIASALGSSSGSPVQPSPEQLSTLIKSWNSSGLKPVNSVSELYGAIKQSGDSPAVKSLIANAFFPDAQVSYSIKLANGKTFAIDPGTKDAADQLFGAGAALTKIIQTADAYGVVHAGEDGQNLAWQPVLAIAKALGLTNGEMERALAKQGPTEAGVPGPVGPGQHTNIGSEIAQANATNEVFNSHGLENQTSRSSGPGNDKFAAEMATGQHMTFTQRVGAYGQALKLYNDPTLAYLASFDPALAARLSTAKKADDITAADKLKAGQLMANGGFDQAALSKVGFFTQTGVDQLLNGVAGGGAGGGSGAQVQRSVVDPAAVEKSVRDLWRAWFQRDPTSSEVETFGAQLQGMLDSASGQQAGGINQQVDPQSDLEKYARSSPEYEMLYGQKPTGMSETDYAAQFQGGAKEMIGNQAADPEDLRRGMQTGDYQTTIGSIAGGPQAMHNSVFLGRLAQAAQLVSENT
jgi:hypothetical protein